MTKLVICKVQVAGFHNWPGAFDGVDYLRSRHRHVFEIEAGIRVTNNDREVEIISTQNRILTYLYGIYGVGGSYECDFKSMSCEDIAEIIIDKFNAYYATVTEDGFGGSTIINN